MLAGSNREAAGRDSPLSAGMQAAATHQHGLQREMETPPVFRAASGDSGFIFSWPANGARPHFCVAQNLFWLTTGQVLEVLHQFPTQKEDATTP
jgi:hypothetical protein